jgi:Bacterial Ig-like domain (group 2)
MQPRTSGMWRLLLTGMLVAGAAACQKTETAPKPTPQVTVTPANSTINVGQTVQLVASVSNTTDQTVTWASASPSIATVDANGLVTGVAAGTATITATTPGGYKGAAAVVVTASSTAGNPQVTIGSVTQGTTLTPVNPQNTFGIISVTANIDAQPGQVDEYKLMVGDSVVSDQTITSGGSVGGKPASAQGVSPVTTSVNTAQFNATGMTANAMIAWPNGPTTIKAEVLKGGTVVASGQATYVFNNANTIAITWSAPNTAKDANGLSWWGGDVTAQAWMVLYTGGSADRVTLVLWAPAGTNSANGSAGSVSSTDTDGSDGFTATFPATADFGHGGSMGAENSAAYVSASSVMSTGTNGPNGTTNTFMLDNQAPVITLFDLTPTTLGCAPATACYINGAFAFDMANTNLFAVNDGGVGGITTVFMAGAPGSLATVTSGADLPETATSQTDIASATSTDALGNSTTVYAGPTAATPLTSATGAQKFGVDKTAPVATFHTGSIADMSTNSGVYTWQVDYSDSGVGPSGFSATPVRVLLQKVTATGTTCYVPDNAWVGTTVACTTAAGDPNYQNDDGIVAIDPGATGEGYWQITAYVVDQAKNVSTTIARITLQDYTSPVIGGISSPSSLPGAQPATFSAGLADNLDLLSMMPSLQYAGGETFDYPAQTLGSYGDDVLTTSAAGAFAVASFVRAVDQTDATGRDNGVVHEAVNAIFQVTDVAGNQNSNTSFINPAVEFATSGAVPSLTTIDANTFAPTNPPDANAAAHGFFVEQAPSQATVCDNKDATQCTTNTHTSTALSATMTGPNATFANPFTAVNFYYQDPSTGHWKLIGTASATASDNTVTSTRTWTYSVTWSVTGLTAANGNAMDTFAQPINVMAVGVHASGSALMTNGTMATGAVTMAAN